MTTPPPVPPPKRRTPSPDAPTLALQDSRARIDADLAGPIARMQRAAVGARAAGAALKRTASSERLAAVRAADATGPHAPAVAPPPKPPARDPRREPED